LIVAGDVVTIRDSMRTGAPEVSRPAICPRSIHRLIEVRSAARPDARAVVLGDEALSYGELNARANRLAHRLVAHGVGPEVIVGVHLERSLDLVVALLAVLKAGGGYLPLDPSYPADRLAFMLADCRAPVVIARGLDVPFTGVVVDPGAAGDAPTTNLARDVDPENVAYVIYTSGSTGTPKGVVIPHDRVLRLMASTAAWFQFDERDVWTWFHSYAFDFSVWEIWGALLTGGTVVVVPEAVRRSPDDLLALLAAQQVTVLDQVPSAFRHLIAAATRTARPVPLALRYVIFGGEALELRGLIPWFERYPGPRLVNMYGITETTVHVTYRVIDPAECATTRGSPIGIAIPDLELHLLDATLARVADGAEGELHVGGAGLARGYHARAALTAERFVPDPFSGRPGARLYRTGDLARRLPDGSLDYLGRNDTQVKIRGYRIETGEIAARLGSHPAVREAAVIARDEGDDRRLVAYVALRSPAPPEALRGFLGDQLPGYMIPSAFVVIGALPTTPSGKLDVAALPALDAAANAPPEPPAPPETDDERMLAVLWSQLLGGAPVGRGDRFFELGGHSLLAAQVVSRLATDHGVVVPVRLLLTSPTLAEAAAGFAEARRRQGGRGAGDAGRIPPRPHADRAPISFAQEAIWVHDHVLRDVMRRPRGYLECPVLQLRGPVVAALLERALNEIAARHEIWRTSFVLEDEPVQRIGQSARIPLRLHDRRGIAPGSRRAELEAIAEALAGQPFVLARVPLVRCALVTFAEDEHALLVMLHHLVTDAWSEHLIAAELARLYGFLAAGEPLPPRTEVERQYGDHAAWERTAGARDDSRTFWRGAFANPPAPLALARPVPPNAPNAPNVDDASSGRPIRLARSLGPDVSAGLAAFCRRRNLSLSPVLYAAFARILEPHAAGGRFVLGVATANRTPASERLPGCFTGVLPIVVELAGRSGLETVARDLMTGIAEAIPHGALPLPEIARLVGWGRGAPLVQVQASTQLTASRYDAGPVSFAHDYVPVNDAKFALELVVQQDADHAVTLAWVADPASFDRAGVARVADALEAVLAAELGDHVGSVGSVSSVGPADSTESTNSTGATGATNPASPASPIAQVVTRLWCEALRIDRVAAHDDFFELGGHSLLAIRLVSKICAELGVQLSLGQFFAAPTVEGVAAEIERLHGQRAARPIVPVRRDGLLPLSSVQERLWFVERMLRADGTRPYNVSIALGMRGDLDAELLARCFTEVIARHEIWRTNFRLVGRNLVQVIAPPFAVELPLAVDRAIAGPNEGTIAGMAREDRVRELARAQAGPAFDLAHDRLVRARLVQLGPGEHVLLLAIHHIVYDAASIDVLVRELSALYDAFRAGRPSPLAPLAVQYADIAHWQRHAVAPEELDRQLAYWTQQLAGAPAVELPADFPRPPEPDHPGAHLVVAIPRVIAAAARELAQREGASLYMMLLAVFYAQLARRTGQTDLSVGMGISTRDRPELEAVLGPLLNLVVLRTDVSGDPTLRELVQRVRGVVRAAFEHQDAPFEKVTAALHRARGASRAPLFQVSLGVISTAAAPPAPEGQLWRIEVPDTGSVLDDLSIRVSDDGVDLVAAFEYRTDLFERTTIAAIAAELEILLGRALDAPDRPLSQLFAPRCAHELFRDRARAVPDAIAVIHGDRQLSYAELERRANRVAHALRARGVGPEARVAICVDRSLDMIAGVLGILKAGGAYLPLDPAYPLERLRFMLDDARPVLVLTQHHLRGVVPDAVPVLEIEAIEGAEAIDARDDTAPAVAVDPQHLAYVIYTSGSMGQPKGALIPHAALSNLIANRMFGVGPSSRVLQLSSLSFDVSVWEIFATLAAGGTLVLAPAVELQPGKPLIETLRRHAITILVSPPSVLAALRDTDLPALATVVSGGEACSPELALRWGAGRRFLNGYGPTETTVCATWADCTDGRVTLGTALAGTAVHVLDPLGHPVGPGMTGELHIAGAGLARGYHGRAALTAEKFVPDPFSHEAGARMYRTGDHVRLQADGALEFIGRIDDQVKIRGFRIELGEVEAALRAHPGVRQAAAAARGSSPADMRLVGYMIVTDRALDPAQVLAFLARSLPAHLVPSALVILDAFPMTPAGKVDRAALPSPRGTNPGAGGGDGLAVQLAAIFAEVLEVPTAGIDDNFFELGGHSILVVHLIGRIDEMLGVEVPLRAVFEAPTPRLLAKVIAPADPPPADAPPADAPPADAPPADPPPSEAEAEADPIVFEADDLPLSHAQQRMWFLHQLAPDSAAYNLPYARRLRGPLDVEALRRAIEAAIHRHDVLRTAFPAQGGVPRQAIARRAAFVLPRSDVSSVPAAEREAALARLAEADVDRPFELAARPPLRARLVRVAAEDHVLVVTMHHIISDARSLELFWRDVTAAYAGEPPRAAPMQYAAYARNQLSGAALERQLAYWTTQLADAPVETDLPYRSARPRVSSAPPREISIDLGAALSNELRELARRAGTTMFMTCLAALRAVLARVTGQDDLCIGAPISTRGRAELNEVAGLFVNTLVFRTRVDRAAGFTELLHRERDTALEAYTRQDAPFERVVQALGIERGAGNPLFQVSFAHEATGGRTARLGGVRDEPYHPHRNAAQFDLEVETWERGASIEVRFIYKEDLFEPWVIGEMAEQLARFVREVVREPGRAIARVPLVSARVRVDLVTAWNRPEDEDEGDDDDDDAPAPAIAAVFEAQVDRTPDATAVVLGDARLTYRQLDDRADRIAAALRAHGVGPDTIVGIALERSFELVAAVLGVWKAGGAYVPLDPALPAARRQQIAAASRPRAIVSMPELEDELAELALPIVYASTPSRAPARRAPPAPVAPDHLAYVIFTSGSTGTPKGVMVSQCALANELAASTRTLGALAPADGFLQLAPYTFDQAVHEILWPLVSGARLVLVAEGDQRDPAKLVERIQRGGVTILDAVPTLLRALVAEPGFARCDSLRLIVAGGEPLPIDLARAVFAARPGVPVMNGYGPTEAAITVCYAPVHPGATVVVLGKPWDNVQFYVIDRDLEPVALGMAGELYIAGRQVARGYAGRPDLTAERFVPDPFAPGPGRRMVRTGDRVRRRPDGTLELLGRVDDQVKLRGFRIELGEIEHALRRHAQVAACAVIAAPSARGSADRQLVAYVVLRGPTESMEPMEPMELRDHLAAQLPAYMVPAAYVVLDALPLTASGKLDRRALPAPDVAAPGHAAPVKPRDEVERVIAAIWCEVLELASVGVHDDFFALGGHSLVATQIVSRVRAQLDVALALQQLFDHPTVEGLAAEVAKLASRPAQVAATPIPRGEDAPLSYAQQGLWLLHRLFPDSAAYHMPSGRRLRGPLDAEALRRAFEDVAGRHEILRTAFPAPDGAPRQHVLAPARWALAADDLSGLDEADRRRALDRIAHDEATRPFDLAVGPVLRTRLVRLAPADHVVLVTMHHIVSDGWSFDVFWREVAACYAGHHRGRPVALPPLPLQYADFAAAQRAVLSGAVLDRALAYWKQQLAGAPGDTALPHQAPRSAGSATAAEIVIQLDPHQTGAVRAVGRREAATLFMTLLAVFRAVVARTTGQDDLVIGTPVASRDRQELEGLIGLFVNTLALRGAVDPRATFAELVRGERATVLAAYAHQDAPFELIVDALGVERSPTRTPVFQLWFVQENVPAATLGLDRDLAEEPFHRGPGASKFDLSVYVNEAYGAVELALVFNAELLHPGVVGGIARRFERALELAADAPDRALAELDFGDPPADGDPRVPLDRPAYPPVLETIAELARRDPDAPALRHGDRTTSRGELAAAAARVAVALAAAGIVAGDRVALTGPPGPALYAGFLGILQHGACLVPLSSRLPGEHAARLLERVDARVVLHAGAAPRAYGRVPSATVAADGVVTLAAALAAPARPADPAIRYIYFTSGTTGAQKGVLGNLEALAHFVAWQRQAFGALAGDVSAQLTELGFDVFLRDTMFALTSGKLLAAPPDELSELAPGELLRWLERARVTAIHTVPSLARAWLADAPPDVTLAELRCVFVVGEPLDAALVVAWRARFGAGTEFINLYGTTETGPAKSWYRVPHPPLPGVQPIGRALPETQLLILRDGRSLCADGEVGEVVIRTPFSTLGYLDGDGAGAFTPNPFRSDPADRLYRTGDLGRHRPDGAIELLGRADDQVKLRGQRVDPSGIAAALRAHAGVRDAAVIAARADGELRLVAYVVRAQPPPSASELRERLRQTVPPYMVPAGFVFLDVLPRKPNGKLDRAALPAPDWGGGAPDTFTAPRSPEEEAIAAIWCEVLGIERVSVRDDFFALGGHSLLAVLVASRVRAVFGVELGIQTFFEAPTVEGLAAEVVRARAGASSSQPIAPIASTAPIARIARTGELPLSFAQQRMWFLHRLAPANPAYHVPLGRRLRGALAREALRDAFEQIVRRHEALRTVFPSHDGVPRQQIDAPGRWELPFDDLSELTALVRDAAAERIARDEAERPFDLATGPVLRTRLVRLAPDDHLLLVTLHHVVSDGWSMAVFWSEVSELYRASTTGTPAGLAALPVQYADFAAWQRAALAGGTLDHQLAYWKAKLAGAPAQTALPRKATQGPRPATASARGGMVAVELDEAVVGAMRALGRKTGATQFITLLAAFRAVLARTTGQDDLCIGTPIANRGRKEVEPLIGCLLNTLVLRTRIDPQGTFSELVRRERATALEAYAHQDAPFELIVDALAIERSLDRTPLFQVSFVHQNMPQRVQPIGDLIDEPYVHTAPAARFDLSVVSFERDRKVAVELIYDEALFERWQIEQLADQLVYFLRDALQGPERPVARIPVVSDDQRRQLLVQWNRTPGDVVDATIPAVFEAQVDRTPEAIALVLGTAQLTYRGLDARANRIAHALAEHGVGPEVVVGIALERSFDLVAAMLGTSKAGAAWVPLDPQLPGARLAAIAAIARPKVVLATTATAAKLPAIGAPVVTLDAPALDLRPATRPAPGVSAVLDADQLAYVLFTSGSTGRPKGVMISHRGIVNELVSAQALRARLGGDDAFLQLAPCTFDLSVHEILWPLSAGARVVLLPEGDHRDPRRIVEEIRARQVTILHPVPTLLRALLADPDLDRCTSLRTVVSGGEAMPLDVLRTFTSRRPDLALVNSYGPTETSVTVSQWRARADATAVAIGTPWIATQLYVLDRGLEPVAPGVAGELYIGGRQVGRGYAGQPAQTAERFVPDPFAAEPGARLYRTGDRARRWPDGNVELIGRVDDQVKLRGFRIELGEIEAVLRDHAGVRDAVVTLHGAGEDARLVAHVVGDPWSAEAARAFLAARLPDYMVPRVYVRIDALPLGASGKVDRAALPAPGEAALERRAYEPPRGGLEEILAGIWSELLGIERIGRRDNFFDLGGHSLLAARLAWEAKASIAMVFSAPTLAELAAAIEASGAERGGAVPPVVPVARGGELALSYAQQRMWFLHQLAPASPAYHLALGRRLRGPLDAGVLAGALGDLIARHEGLRTAFPAPRGVPYQDVQAPAPWPLPCRDLAGLPDRERAAELARISDEETTRPFDLSCGPLVRTALARTAPDDHVLHVTCHHIVADGWSVGVFWHELAELYAARVQGRASALAPLAFQVADHAAWQRTWLTGDVLDAQLAYWKQRLAGAPEDTALPIRGPRPPVATHRGASASLRLDRALRDRLRALARQHGCTLFITLLAALRALLYRYTGQRDLCIGAPTANRGMRELEGLIGLFVNTLVLRTPTAGSMTFAELLGHERTTALEAFAHGEAPFEMIVEALGVARSLARNPLFQVMFQVQLADDDQLPVGLPGVDGAPIERGLISTQVDLDVSALVHGDGIELELVYNVDLFDAATIRDLARHFRALLDAAVADPGTPIAELALLDGDERDQLAHAWNHTARAMPPRTLPVLIDERAACTPDAIAIVSRAGTLTYGELAARAHQLAHHLRARGLAREERVGICLDRGPDLVVAMLGVLAAGGAYLPLDAELPAERLAYMAADAGVRVVLTGPELLGRVPAAPIVIDVTAGALAGEPTAPLADAPALAQLAYVLYTSGSTGRPKPVHIQHGSLVNFLASMRDAPGLTEHDTLLAVTTASFDISGLELYLPLLAGARVVVAGRDDARDGARLLALLADSGATVMQATPSTWRLLVEAGWQPRPGFVALCGGEALPPELAAQLVPRVAALWNLYGPTETTIWSARQRILAGAPIRLGEPIANTQLHVLDPDALGVQPLEVAGELFIAGDGLARGYGGHPGLTAERFLPDPYAAAPGARMYRTGDRVRRRAGGELEFLGRVDHQIKLRGFRIEPGEIEAVLGDHPGVAEAVVVVRDDRLVAYVVALGRPPEPAALLAAARARLPDYMIPSAVVVLDELPRTPAGKLDRNALPAPDRAAFVAAGDAAPRDEIEDILAGIWGELLGIAQVGIHDDFFALGGHSLLAVRVVWAVRRAFAIALPLAQLFRAPTIAGLAAAIQGARREHAPLPRPEPVDRAGELPLSYAQQRMWFLHQLTPASPAYNLAAGLRLRGALDVPALAGALGDTVRRHEALRTRFPATHGVPRQQIDEVADWPLPIDDLSHAGADQAEALARYSRDEANRPFDLAADALLRTRLVRLAPDDHVVLATMHHIISDGWSLAPFWADVRAYYLARTRGAAAPAALPIQYADHAAWQRRQLTGEVLDRQLAYWKHQLAGAPEELALPRRGPRPAMQTFRGGLVLLELPRDLAGGLRAIARRESATLAMALLSGFRALLHRYTGQADVCIGVPAANRTTADVEQLVGLFVNTLVLRTTVDPDAGFAALVARERTTALEAFAHQDAPFEMVIDALGVPRALDRNPLFQVLFQVLFEADEPPPGWGDATAEVMARGRGSTHLDLDISALVHRDRIELAFAYHADLFEHETVVELAQHFRTLLEVAVAAPDQPIATLALLTAEQRHRIVVGWNATARDYAGRPFVVAAIEAQVDRTPGAVAVTFEGASLTYRELELRANQLAHHLIEAGARRDQPIGVCLERSLDLIVALLAILKAGAPYLPIDPSYPALRARAILDDAGCTLVVGHARHGAVLGGVAAVWLDASQGAIARRSTARPRIAIDGDTAAYVIFTSGSTGRPKGAVLTHAGLRNRLAWMQDAFAFGAGDAVLHKTPFTFDVSVWELFWPLTAGARLVIARPGGHRDPVYLAEVIRAERITLVHFVPSLLGPFLEVMRGVSAPSLGRVICSGEALTASLERACAEVLGVELHNLYGPTEATIEVSWWRCEESRRAASVPIGFPVANTRLYVLDRACQPVPIGAPGELFISGVQLARGYRRRPDLTAERFVPDPFVPGERMYRTGDLARHRRDGAIEFLGRIDHQVKIRGFRIELDEIEAVLREHPQVREAVVVARKRGAGAGEGAGAGDGDRLVAYVVAAPAGTTAEALLEHVRGRLPEYMVPAAIVILAALPLTSSGKADRNALPEPDWAPDPREHVAARNAAEGALVAIWQQVLGVPRVGVRDDFFALGGHSLLAIRLLWEINRAFGATIPLARVFSAPTIEQFAALPALAGDPRSPDDGVALVPTQRTSGPATALQGAHHDMHRDDPTNEFVHMAIGLAFEGTLDRGALERALTELLRRHAILRTNYREIDGRLVQLVVPADHVPPFALEVTDLSAVPEPARLARQRAAIGALRARTFDLTRDLPVRGALVVQAPARCLLVLILHHACGDGASIPVVVDEIVQLYRHHAAPGHPAPAAPVLQFLDFADYVERFGASPAGLAQRAYWTHRLAGAPPVALPVDHDRAAVDHRRDAAPRGMACYPTHSVTASVPAVVRDDLAVLARETDATMMMILLAGFAATLHGLTGQDEICVQSTISQRSQPALERMIGVVANPVILRLDLAGHPSFRALARRTQATVVAAFEHGLVPIIDRAPHGLRRINFNFNSTRGATDAGQDAEVVPGLRAYDVPIPLEEAKTPFDLHLWLFERGDGIFLRLLGNQQLFHRDTCERLLARFTELLARVARDPSVLP
jgi:amino acid adenylation domain-containing protein